MLVAGGYVGGSGGAGILASSELYGPATGVFGATGAMATTRAGARATLLADGRVLVAGGYNAGASGQIVPLATAELYDPATGTFTPTGSMANARYNFTQTPLADGRVLVAGGMGWNDATAGLAELYDPTSGTFAAARPMTAARVGQTATLLADGRVLIVGGLSPGGHGNPTRLSSAELYDPTTGAFAATGPMATPRYDHAAALLPDGRILISGGMDWPGNGTRVSLSSAELYDPASGTFAAANPMAEARSGQCAVALPGGRVMIAGGLTQVPSGPASYPTSAELYDPAGGSFEQAGSMSAGRYGATATLLLDGRVLIVGGANAATFALATAELYQP